ncbi:MAG: LPS sulfotransferase NodH [Pseudohongiellaceae bacterium]|jgi:LPS sulfotransferase NodH
MFPTPYSRFVIMGAARSGTTYLQTLLASHPDIVCFSELFHLLSRRGHDLDDIVRDPVEYVTKAIYRSYPSDVKAVGYKLLYSQIGANNHFLSKLDSSHVHPATKETRDAFSAFMAESYDLAQLRQRFAAFGDFIKSDQDLRLIHITRANKLEMFLSLRQAGLSKAWNSKAGSYSPDQIHLDGEECERFFSTTASREDTYTEFFRDHSVMSVSYGDLTRDTEPCLARVQQFLNLRHSSLASPLEKQGRRAMVDVIANYGELKMRFSGTRWEQYFRDETVASPDHCT